MTCQIIGQKLNKRSRSYDQETKQQRLENSNGNPN